MENTTTLILVDLVLYLLILPNPILLPIILKLDLVLHLIILNSMNIEGRRVPILSHTQLILVDTIVWPKCSSMPIREVLVPVIPIQYGLLRITDGLSRFLFDLERLCTIALMESGIQTCLKTFMA